MTACNGQQVLFSSLGRRQIEADWGGGRLTSDAGAVLLREIDRRIGLLDALSRCIRDPRNPIFITHEQRTLLAQRVLGIALGYEDLNDQQGLREDPLFQVITERGVHKEQPFGSPPTLCRCFVAGFWRKVPLPGAQAMFSRVKAGRAGGPRSEGVGGQMNHHLPVDKHGEEAEDTRGPAMKKKDIIDRNVAVTMRRETLTDIPAYPLPAGYQIRPYSPGDEHEWLKIESAADQFNAITIELFRRQFGDDPAVLAERQFFLLDRVGTTIGTGTAWFESNHHGHPYGRVHWLAIHPRWQGRGLSKPLMTRVCSRLRELGHDKARLGTSSARIKAINLYLHFGFRPEIRGPEDECVWDELKGHLRHSPDQSPGDRAESEAGG